MNEIYRFVNEPLEYSYDALEPFIDAKTMEIHHNRYLQKYIDDLNNFIENNEFLKQYTLDEMLKKAYEFPEFIQRQIINYAGGVYNHRFFFDGMKNSELEDNINNSSYNDYCPDEIIFKIEMYFDSIEDFRKLFKESAMSVFGSGYAWLVIGDNQSLEIIALPNQDNPLSIGKTPLLNIDVWEHAYFLKHYNNRSSYIEDWFNVINWKKVCERLLAYHKLKF